MSDPIEAAAIATTGTVIWESMPIVNRETRAHLGRLAGGGS